MGCRGDDKKTIKDAFLEWNYETSDAGIKKYNSSYVYKVYDWTEYVNYDIIQKDVDQLIDKYLGIISSSISSKTYSKQDNTDLKNVPEKSVKKEISILDFQIFSLLKSFIMVLQERENLILSRRKKEKGYAVSVQHSTLIATTQPS